MFKYAEATVQLEQKRKNGNKKLRPRKSKLIKDKRSSPAEKPLLTKKD
jgi:hypothetical protein